MRVTLLWVGWLMMPAALGAQGRSPGGLDEASARLVEAIVWQAQADGLPADALRSKVAEGLSKGAGGPRIVEAVRRLDQRMRRASAALGAGASAAELIAGGAVLELGVPDAALGSLRATRADGSVASALVGLAFLVQRGMPVERSVPLVRELLEARVTEADFTRFRRLVEQDVRSGAPTAGAAEARARAWTRSGETARVPEFRP